MLANDRAICYFFGALLEVIALFFSSSSTCCVALMPTVCSLTPLPLVNDPPYLSCDMLVFGVQVLPTANLTALFSVFFSLRFFFVFVFASLYIRLSLTIYEVVCVCVVVNDRKTNKQFKFLRLLLLLRSSLF